jgi:hypothetical protein
MRKLGIAAAIAVALVTGMVLEGARGGTPPSAAPAAATPAREVVVERGAAPTADIAALRAEVRAMRQALEARPGEPVAQAQAQASAPEAPPSDPIVAARARQIVAAGQTAHRWTRDDVAALHGVFPLISRDEQEEILTTLIPALNSGEIHLDDDVHGAVF